MRRPVSKSSFTDSSSILILEDVEMSHQQVYEPSRDSFSLSARPVPPMELDIYDFSRCFFGTGGFFVLSLSFSKEEAPDLDRKDGSTLRYGFIGREASAKWRVCLSSTRILPYSR